MKKKWAFKYIAGLLGATVAFLGSAQLTSAAESCCAVTEEEMQQYQEDGTWEERQAYVESLNQNSVSEGLLMQALERENGIEPMAILPSDWRGMQTTGTAKMLVIQVEFQDITFENSPIYSAEELYGMFNGNGSAEAYPYESLQAYYSRSSYGKLQIESGDVYRYTLSQNREAYVGAYIGEQELLREVLTGLDEQIDYNDYDANHDGVLDGICINFAGGSDGWGTTWWSHAYSFEDETFMLDGVHPAKYLFLLTEENTFPYEGFRTLIHETGHLLGLPDYYASTGGNVLDVNDMMADTYGDHNGFSKWLLGWIDEDQIQKITKSDEKQTVNLYPLSGDDPQGKNLIAVIAPEETGIFSEYLVVQYDEPIGNQIDTELWDNGYRIYHVNAELNESGSDFLHSNFTDTEKYLIQNIHVPYEYDEFSTRTYYIAGDALTPQTNPSSAFYSGYGGTLSGFTGITLSDFVTGEEPSFGVSFEEKPEEDGKLNLTVGKEAEAIMNRGYLRLTSNRPLERGSDELCPYYEDEKGNRYNLQVFFKGNYTIELEYYDISNSLKPNTEYTLVIPEGVFSVDGQVLSKECQIPVKTADFPLISSFFKNDEDSMSSSIFSIDGDKAAYVQQAFVDDTKWNTYLYVYDGTNDPVVTNAMIPIPEEYQCHGLASVDAFPCSDGIAVAIVNWYEETLVYKISKEGKYICGPFAVPQKLKMFYCGDVLKGTLDVSSGPVGAPANENDSSKVKVYTFDFEHEPVVRELEEDSDGCSIAALGNRTYAVVQMWDAQTLRIYNQDDHVVRKIDLSDCENARFCTIVEKEGKIGVLFEDSSLYEEKGIFRLFVNRYDADGTFFGQKEVLTYSDWKFDPKWMIQQTKWGYLLSCMGDVSQRVYYFLDSEWNLITSMEGEQESSGTALGERFIMQWRSLDAYGGFTTAITEPVAKREPETPTPTPTETPTPTVIPTVPTVSPVDLGLCSGKVTNTSIALSWSKVNDADGYIIYGSPCNSGTKKYTYKKLKTITNNNTLTWTQKNLKKGTHYKYKIKAYQKINGKTVVMGTSIDIHVTTKGGKYGVAKAISIDKISGSKSTKAVTLKKGKSAKITAREVPADKPIRKHRSICYESTNKNVVTVSNTGVIQAKGKGSCKIFVYAQNGIYRSITVTVK